MPEEQNGNEGAAEVEESGGSAWTPPESEEEFNRIMQDRLNRQAKSLGKKYADYESLKEKAARADALDHELSSETEKAVKAAREEERGKTQAEFSPRLVRAEFRAAAKGVLSAEQLDSLLEDLDLSRYTTDDGSVDEEKVEKKVSAFAPKKDDRTFPDLGGGKRGGTATTTNMNALIRRAAGHGE